MQIITLCKYEGMLECNASTWEAQEAGCSFAIKASKRDYCQHYGLKGDTKCDCLGAQKIAYENHNNKQ